MRILRKNMLKSLTGALLLSGLLAGNSAMAITVDQGAQIGSLPQAGWPSFDFNDGPDDYSNTIESWFQNIVYINDVGGGYTFQAYNEGNFTYWDDANTSYQGVGGVFSLSATMPRSSI